MVALAVVMANFFSLETNLHFPPVSLCRIAKSTHGNLRVYHSVKNDNKTALPAKDLCVVL